MTATAGAPGARTCNTQDMVMVHRIFRYMFKDAPDLVRAVADGDTERAGIVGGHILFLTQSLHNHHHTEDEYLWDDLEARAPSCALHVGLMRKQHADVAVLIDQVQAALPAWEASASVEERDRVADLVGDNRDVLEVHLGNEEDLILPVAATSFTQAEWDRLGEHATDEIPKDMMLIQLGWMLEALGPEVGGAFLKRELPLPVRLIWATVGKRKFARHKALVLGQ